MKFKLKMEQYPYRSIFFVFDDINKLHEFVKTAVATHLKDTDDSELRFEIEVEVEECTDVKNAENTSKSL